ncbi:hypothetical protein INT08_11240 [Prosthecochloris sp. N3]|uniref:Uncharacterized protein n=1 Tax=Prosthecochloris ethylica TaxID=2743976 RepID=A0ABR9XUR4_9CHLB|nr:hypothetical protein [Prosthecochloris ethylica]MBF0587457.1 hypothetical protein [Prosthecochloris ethylica]MBF0637734.1 hypothetical protein [Prosthecochloris ethylica]NUK48683.1 hypothetical protein [Prosthecochloris ethylica]
MLRFAPKLLLVLTAFAPVMLTFAAVYWFDNKQILALALVGGTILLVFTCVTVIKLAASQLAKNPVIIKTIKPADKEIVGFVLAYLLPLARGSQFDGFPMLIVLGVFLLVVMTSNAYHTNPLLGLIGYHFYEVTVEDVGYTLLSKRNLHNTRAIKTVVSLTDYMLLDVTK